MNELLSCSAVMLARAIREKRVSSAEVVDAYLERIASVNPQLNAVVQLVEARARDEARAADAMLAHGEVKGPLHGVPFTAKDVFETEGIISAAGVQRRARFVPARDAAVVARLRAAGGILLGKTNVPERGSGVETDNPVYGRTNNPYDRSRSPGGSSGGEAAIIAAGGSPAGVGSDAGGSIRLPAHVCGIAGLKPTSGRVPSTGHFPPVGGLADPRTQVGPLARHVEDLALLLSVMAGPDGVDATVVPLPLDDPQRVRMPDLRVAWYADDGVLSPTEETVATVQAAARALADLGALVEDARPPGVDQSAGITSAVWKSQKGEMPGHQFYKVLERWDAFRSTMLGFMERYDAILCPTCAFPAQPHGALRDLDGGTKISYTLAFSLTGWPVATVRCGTDVAGLPIGVQVAARPWREDAALAVAGHLEQALGGWRPPPL